MGHRRNLCSALAGAAWLFLAAGFSLAWGQDDSEGRFIFLYENDIWVCNADGSGKKNLTNSKLRETSPKLSPDGKKILFLRGRAIPGDICVMNVDGSGVKKLLEPEMGNDVSDVSWSPDGQTIVFVHSGFGLESEIRTIQVDGSGAKTIVKDGRYNKSPVWSPDGRRIAYVSAELITPPGGGKTTAPTNIAVVNAGGSGKRTLTDRKGEDSHPRWSPDGSDILFLTQEVTLKDGKVTRHSTRRLCVMGSDGSGRKRVGGDVDMAEIETADWSPDSRHILFAGRKGSNPETIYRYTLSDGSIKALIKPHWGPNYKVLTCSPDGKSVLFLDGFYDIGVLKIGGKPRKKVVKGTHPAWIPER